MEIMASWRAMVLLLLLLLVLYSGRVGKTQVAWTPIYVDGNSQVDLWTVSGSGCSCSSPLYSSSSRISDGVSSRRGGGTLSATTAASSLPGDVDCACCVRDGGCPCGAASPRRCTQCGLEAHCLHMCNVTIDSRVLQTRSGKAFGQIKSPSLVGPGSCWYLLLADRNQRIEIQVYRLVSVGHFNGTSCQSGFLELSENSDVLGRKSSDPKGSSRNNPTRASFSSSSASASGLQLCGENERFAPPAVLFADRSSATLLFQVSEPTLRSQFFAYFSFTSSDHVTLGIPNRGGKRLEYTECDWAYQEYVCRGKQGKENSQGRGENRNEDPGCVLASPGHPGVYPPNRRCKYLVTTSSMRTRVQLTFTSLLLPYNHCETDYIAIYKGSTNSSPLLTTICGSRKTTVDYSGPNMLIEFSSGPPIPPYDYNGFVAQLEFIDVPEVPAITESSIRPPAKTTEAGLLMDENTIMPRRVPNTICDYIYYGNTTRSGHFDTRAKVWQPSDVTSSSSVPASTTCKLIFYGRNSDVVHLSFFNYDLKAASCESSVEVFDGKMGKNGKSLQKLCSPLTRHARNSSGRFLEQHSLVSSGNILTVVIRRGVDSSKEFVDGAFLFHDERLEGTLQPSTLCDVVYDGVRRKGSIRREGQFGEPVAGRSHQLLWNVEGPLRCSQRFELSPGQGITLKLLSAERLGSDHHCTTRCQTENGGGGIMDEDLVGGGCSCVPNLLPLSQMDHLVILSTDGLGRHVSCLCGDFQHLLPISVKSTTSLTVEYRVAHYSWGTRSFGFKANYKFEEENSCGERIKVEPSGSIDSKNKMKSLPAAIRNYYHESCTWLLQSRIERQLTVEIYTSENKPCNVWNITLLQYRESMLQEASDWAGDDKIGQLLYTFCPKQRKKTFKLPWKQNSVFIRLSSLSNSPAEYSIRWKSQIVRANNRVAPAAGQDDDSMSEGCPRHKSSLLLCFIAYLYLFHFKWEQRNAIAY